MQSMGSTHPPVGAALPLLATAAVLLVGCGGGGDGTDRASSSAAPGAGSAKAVTIKDYTYAPATITVPVGTTVTFTNRDSTPHTATSKKPGAFESGSIDTGRSGEVKLEQAGTFAYYCAFHPFMKGTIVVE
jgi:plastocyanin